MSDKSTRELEAVAKALCSLLDVPPTQGNVFVIADEIGRRTARIADLERQLAEARLSAQTIGDELGNQINRLLADKAEARNAALEDAAVVADDYELKNHPRLSPGPEINAWWSGQSFASDDIAAAIRAMKQEDRT